jgi:hypothetical protein
LRKINLYLPIDFYVKNEQNVLLAKTISSIRDKYMRNDIDWKTVGTLASDSRFLFSVVVKNFDEQLASTVKIESSDTQLVLPSLSDIPYLEFIDELKSYFGIYNINLCDLKANTDVINEQLFALSKSIAKFLSTDGKDIFLHLSNNTAIIDSKTNSILFSFFKILQLLEDKTSVVLSDNVKFWARLILLKCKRGISEKEYNFEQHPVFKMHNFDNVQTSVDIETSKDKLQTEMLAESLLKQKDKEEQDKKSVDEDLK